MMPAGIGGMSIGQLVALQHQIDPATQLRKQILKFQQEHAWGERFTHAVGIEMLANLPEVDAAQLKLDDDHEGLPDRVTPDLFKEPAVRGITGKDRRPFIAIKLLLIDPKTRKVVDTIVLLVFKRFGLNSSGAKGGGDENNIVTAPTCKGASGKIYNCPINGANGMNLEQFDYVRRLLDGITVEYDGGRIVSGGYSICMAKV